jgi:hypothetical protein
MEHKIRMFREWLEFAFEKNVWKVRYGNALKCFLIISVNM